MHIKKSINPLIELFQKKSRQGGWGYTFLKNPPGIFRFVALPLEIPERTSFHHWRFCKIVWHSLKIPRSKTKTHGNSTWFFLEHPWKFYFFLIDSWNFGILFLHYPWKFPILNLPCLEFFWNNPFLEKLMPKMKYTLNAMKFGIQSRLSSLIINMIFVIADLDPKLKTWADLVSKLKCVQFLWNLALGTNY